MAITYKGKTYEPVGKKFYVTTKDVENPYWAPSISTNWASGTEEVTKDEYLDMLRKKIEISSPAERERMKLDRLVGEAQNISPTYNIPGLGTNISEAQVLERNQMEANVAAGTWKNVGTEEAPLFIPVGSAGDLNLQGKSFLEQLKTPTAQLPGVVPVNPLPTTGQTEIKTDGAPPLPTVAGDVAAGGSGATVSGQSTIDQLQKRIDELAAQKPSEEVAKQKKSILDLIRKRETTRETQKSATELRQEALTQAYSEMGVTPEQIQKIGGLIGEVTTYNQQIADLEIKKQQDLDNLATAGKTTSFYGLEQNSLTKKWNSEISAKALQAGVKVQELQMIQGAYADAKATAAQIVNLATYDQQQEVADIEWALNAHQDLYNLLSGEEQTQWNRQYTMAKDALTTAKTTLTNRSNYVVDPATADAFKGIDWTSLTDEEFTNTLAKYTSSQAYLNRVAQLGAAGRAPETQNEDFNSDMAMVSTYGDRDTALTTLNNMKTALVNKYGANRYQQLLSEVDRIFPAPEPKVSKPPSLPGVAEAGKATKSFLKEAFAGEFSTKYIGEPVLKAGQAVSSFFKGLFGG